MLNNYLPIIKENQSLSLGLTPSEYRNHLDEQLQLQRLVGSTVNDPNSKQLKLEPVVPKLFDLYKNDQDMPMEDVSFMDKDNLVLLPVGTIYDPENDPPETPSLPLATLNIEEYKARRKQQAERSNQINYEADTLIPLQAAISQPTPVIPNIVYIANGQQSIIHQPPVVQPLAITSTSEESMDTATGDGSPNESMHTAPNSPVESEIEAQQEIDKSVELEIEVQQDIDQPVLYDSERIDTSLSTNSNQKVYAYTKHIVPIFATPQQEGESDELIRSPNARSPMHFLINFIKAMDILNFLNTDVDLSVDDEWRRTGKVMFLKLLLDQLAEEDKILAILTYNFDEEGLLARWFENQLELNCARIGQVKGNKWTKEYGLFVKTNKADKTASHEFKAEADAVLCFDMRIQSQYNILKSISPRTNTTLPVVTLVTLGSIESRAFNYLTEHELSFEDAKSGDNFKRLFSEENKWPKNDSEQEAIALNELVAKNFCFWLLNLTTNHPEYQFRDLNQLPGSFHFANIISAETNVQPTLVTNNDVEDMDISDDDDDDDQEPTVIQAVPKSLSPELTNFIERIMFPTVEIAIQNNSPVQLPASLKRNNVDDVVNELRDKYIEEMNTLKNQFEKEISLLQEKYKREVKEAILK